jgi:hypothetical protein
VRGEIALLMQFKKTITTNYGGGNVCVCVIEKEKPRTKKKEKQMVKIIIKERD